MKKILNWAFNKEHIHVPWPATNLEQFYSYKSGVTLTVRVHTAQAQPLRRMVVTAS